MQRDGHDKKPGTGSDDSFTQKNSTFTILVVEGLTALEASHEQFFKAEGHTMLKASSAVEALAMTQEHWPDLILLDKDMKDADGLKFFPQLLLEHPSAAVIIMASLPSPAEAVEALNQGAVDYLDRPVDLKKLKQAIDAQKALYKAL